MGDKLRRAAARFIVGFDGTELTPELSELLDLGVGGVTLFRRNVVDPPQVARLIASIRQRAGRPLFICVDQEGGPVQRLRSPFTELPPAAVLGRIGDLRFTARVAAMLARELLALGFNVDWAPVADVDTNPANPVIGVRSFGREPKAVSEQVTAFCRAMQSAGVMACAKHFPGHGDTSVDSHLDLPRVDHDRRRMESVELPPFRAAIRAGVGSIMTAHVLFPRLDPRQPATLSRKVLTGLLRERLHFKGLIVSDDLEMKAIADRIGVAEAAVASLRAGADLLLVCKSRDLALAAIQAAAAGPLSPATDRRIARALARWPGKASSPERAMKVVGRATHRALVEELGRRAERVGASWAPSSPVASSLVATT